MSHCYNRGCGQTFDPNNNKDDACRHHPGVPVFHDAYKGWSCCNKKSTDFTEFLNIKGCTLSKHSNIKPPEPEKPAKIVEEESAKVEVRQPIKAATPRPPFNTKLYKVTSTVDAKLKTAIDELKAKDTKVSEQMLATGKIAPGTKCLNFGCNYSYIDESSDEGQCRYHTGTPVFHEGMKYWSCCQRKTSDFDAFMNQEGCATGKHKWFKSADELQTIQCRYDWLQTADKVTVTIYAKMYDYELSSIQVNPIRLRVELIFPDKDNAKFLIDLELRGIIDVSKTTAQMNSHKVEIVMPKAEAVSWSKLDFPQTQRSDGKTNEQAKKEQACEQEEDNVDLDDIEPINSGLRLTDLASDKATL